MPNPSAAIRRATRQAHLAVEALDAEALGDLTRLYESAARDIRARLAAAAGADDRLSLAELRGILVQVEDQLVRLAQVRGAMMDDTLREAAGLGVAPFDAFTTDRLRVTSGALMRVADDAVRFTRRFIAADGLQLSDRIWRLDRTSKEAIAGAIERAVILGQSAEQAARDLLARNELVPEDLATKARSATGGALGGEVEAAMTGRAYEAKRLMRTELNRAHGEAYMMAGADHPDFAGWRYVLSPAHPRPDICDLYSEQNLYGLGNGVYPTREVLPWPAHPNILSFVEIVFRDEVTDADRAGKETTMQALGRLSPERQEGVLGVGKLELFKAGTLAKGAIRSRLSAARRRAGVA